MKKNKLLFLAFTLGSALLLTGCGKDSKEVALCKKISPEIEKYENNQLSYEGFLNQIEADYNNYCKEEKNGTCTSIELMYNLKKVSLELEDCTKYDTSTDYGKSLKNLCETSNKSKKDMAAREESSQKNNMTILKMDCQNAK